MQPVFLAVLPGGVVRRLAALLSARVVVAFEEFLSTNRYVLMTSREVGHRDMLI